MILGAASVSVRQADIVKAVVGQIPSRMAGRAVRLGVEQRETAFGGWRDRCLVAGDPPVERRAARNDRALVGRKRLRDGRESEALVREHGLEGVAITQDRG